MALTTARKVWKRKLFHAYNKWSIIGIYARLLSTSESKIISLLLFQISPKISAAMGNMIMWVPQQTCSSSREMTNFLSFQKLENEVCEWMEGIEMELKEAADEKIQWEAWGEAKKMNCLMEEMKQKLRTNCTRCTYWDVSTAIATTLYLTTFFVLAMKILYGNLYEK